MGRYRLFTDAEFRIAYDQSDTLGELRMKLGCSMSAVYKHCRRLKLEPPLGVTIKKMAHEVAEAYTGTRTLDDLHEITRMAKSTLRYYIQEWISLVWNDPSHPAYYYAVPAAVKEVKLVNELLKYPKLFDDPDQLAENTNMPAFAAREYVGRSWDRMKRKAKGDVLPPQGRRAKPLPTVAIHRRNTIRRRAERLARVEEMNRVTHQTNGDKDPVPSRRPHPGEIDVQGQSRYARLHYRLHNDSATSRGT